MKSVGADRLSRIGRHCLTKARRRLSTVATMVTKAGAAKSIRTHISPACVAAIEPAIGAIEGELQTP